MDPAQNASTRARAALQERFGFKEFQGPQEQAVLAVLEGRDLLLTLPTGAGKSLTYQLPALLLDGLTLVISPLIALMQDQVDALQEKRIAASFINSSLGASERKQRLERAMRGEYDLLYVTPERFRSPAFLEALAHLRVVRLAVDEAHCISQWGHDFRPDYSRLSEIRKRLGGVPTIAVTATATPRVADDIIRTLELRDPLLLRSGIERPNLFLATTCVDHAEEKLPLLVDRLESIDGPGIVYSTLIRDLEQLESELRRRGRPVLTYHGKLSARERRASQDRFMGSDDQIVLATNAFGMGVDKADIRFVLHAQMPRTLEAWTQEIGRAGRDGEPAWCETVFFSEDVAVQQNFIGWANPDREYVLGVYETLRAWGERIATKDLDDLRDELLVRQRHDHRVSISLKWFEVLGITQGSFEGHDLRVVRDLEPGELPDSVGSPSKLRGDLEGLLEMSRFAQQNDRCRRTLLADHFGLEPPTANCGACDVCTPPGPYRGAQFSPRAAVADDPEQIRSEPDTPFSRGDWVRVDGRHLGQVVGISGEGAGLRIEVESVGDFRRRKIDPRRKKIERIES